jgi:hypothetical protein
MLYSITINNKLYNMNSENELIQKLMMSKKIVKHQEIKLQV